MKRIGVFCSLLVFSLGVFAQVKPVQAVTGANPAVAQKQSTDSLKKKTENEQNKGKHRKRLVIKTDTLTTSDYMMSIERVNDILNDIRDSSKMGFDVVQMSRHTGQITKDLTLIKQNIRDKRSVVNLRNLYLYQSFVNELDEDNTRIQSKLNGIYNRVYHAKLKLKTSLSDSVFRKLYTDSLLRNSFDEKLARLERKWNRSDSIIKSNIDSLNGLKIKVADNAVSLANMLNMFDNRLDKAGKKLFGQEVSLLWKKETKDSLANDSIRKAVNIFGSEQKAIDYYFSQTSAQRSFVLVIGILLFVWLFMKRKLIRVLHQKSDTFSFLHLHYLNHFPVLSLLVVLLCLMPFLDAYAPTSYLAIEYTVLLIIASVIFLRGTEHFPKTDWLVLSALFIADMLVYLLREPSFAIRLILLAIHAAIIVFSWRFYHKLDKTQSYYKWERIAAIVSIVLSALAIFCNAFGRYSLAGILGIAGVYAITQAVILPVFVNTIIEIILLQLQNSRMKKGVDRPFDSSLVLKRIKIPLLIIAVLLWLIMLTSNLNIYHNISNGVVQLLTTTRTIGSISFKLISVLLFFIIIWVAHILQRLISFLFGETGSETEDLTTVSKGQHSRLLITRLLVLIGGYLLAIAASGLPIDKLTFLLGALGVGIGMGLQNVVNNFVSGIILIFDGSLQIGDEIEVNGQAGKVKEIGLRASTLNTADGAEVIIPNGNILSQNIVNWTFSNDQKRVMLAFTLSGKELDANVINEVINETVKAVPNVINQRKPVILYTKVTPESCSLTVRFWSTIGAAEQVKSETMIGLSAAFAKKEIGFE